MDHLHSSTSSDGFRKFPVKTVLVAAAILAAVAAILVFNVPVTTVLTYGFLGIVLFGHFFMHGSHGGHDHGASRSQENSEHSHTDSGASPFSEHSHADGPARRDDPETANSGKDQNSHQGHSGC